MNPPQGTLPNDPLSELWRTWSALAAAAMPQPDRVAPLAQAPGSTPGPVNAVLARANVAGAAVLLKVWTRSAQSLADYQRETQRLNGESAPSAAAAASSLAAQVDHARAHLRRLSDIAFEESRALDDQLLALGEQLRALLEDPAPSAPAPRRYARAKP